MKELSSILQLSYLDTKKIYKISRIYNQTREQFKDYKNGDFTKIKVSDGSYFFIFLSISDNATTQVMGVNGNGEYLKRVDYLGQEPESIKTILAEKNVCEAALSQLIELIRSGDPFISKN